MTAGTPRAAGYRMPAEWTPHAATWIAWPHNQEDWPDRFGPIPWVYADIVRCLSRVERVEILVEDAAMEAEVWKALERADANLADVRCHRIQTNRVWTRDYGPIFVKSGAGQVAMTNWKFNAWAKYDDFELDNAVNGKLQKALNFPCWDADVVLEGGSIDVDGEGSLLTTEECLLSPIQARNPGLTRCDIERAFSDYLGIERVIWLRNGIAGDDTHGHVDDLARWIAPGIVALAMERDSGDENYEALRENREILLQAGVSVVELPMPKPVVFEGRRLPASYANFYFANEYILVPTFNDRHDRIALEALARACPDRVVVGIHSRELIWGLGALHCMTQQQPL